MSPSLIQRMRHSDRVKRLRLTCYEAFAFRNITFPPELKHVQSLDHALKSIQKRWPLEPEEPDSERPVFLFSAGWRSGSTLLQRMLCSSDELVIWGEPLGDAALVPRLAASLSVLSDDWPPDSYVEHNLEIGAFSNQWIANIAPPIPYLKAAHRALFDEWLGKPAREIHGIPRWGFKEVRLTIQHARYLKWLYPEARFVFIYRNLFDAYRSWRGNHWASAWPGYFSWSPVAYARHWKLLLTGFLDGCNDVDGYLVKYEDLVAGKVDLVELAEHIGIREIDAKVLENRISTPGKESKRKPVTRITAIEKSILSFVAGKVLRQAGYSR